jgi:hypothetical protein
MERAVKTIVEYTNEKPPTNQYPRLLVSPPSSAPCCFSGMGEVGPPQEDERWVFQYKRCRQCGYVVRVILREIPDAALAAELCALFAKSFVRGFAP